MFQKARLRLRSTGVSGQQRGFLLHQQSGSDSKIVSYMGGLSNNLVVGNPDRSCTDVETNVNNRRYPNIQYFYNSHIEVDLLTSLYFGVFETMNECILSQSGLSTLSLSRDQCQRPL